MIKKLLSLIFLLALIIAVTSPLTAEAGTKLDEIEEYNMTVDMESDGSMDITYHIDWKVLDDTSEGPLSWVKIGIPNKYVSNITALCDSISSVCYYGTGGDYVRIDLNRNYYAGEIVTMDFSIRLSNVCTLNSDFYYYYFTPGWFDGTDIKSMTILWNQKDALYSDAPDSEGNYYKWTAPLAAGEKFTATVVYSKDTFDIGQPVTETRYSSSSGSGNWSYILYIIIAVILIIVRIVIRFAGGGGYRGGFGRHYGGHYGGHGGFGGGGCACAGCACACACAGGGRAGCSVKNFYDPAAQIDKLKHALQPDQKNIKPLK